METGEKSQSVIINWPGKMFLVPCYLSEYTWELVPEVWGQARDSQHTRRRLPPPVLRCDSVPPMHVSLWMINHVVAELQGRVEEKGEICSLLHADL